MSDDTNPTMDVRSDEERRLKIWGCRIGEVEASRVPRDGDMPMRLAIGRAYREVTGHDPDFCFSGWGAELTRPQRAFVEDRPPVEEEPDTRMRFNRSAVFDLLKAAVLYGCKDWIHGHKTVDAAANDYANEILAAIEADGSAAP